MKGPFLTLDVTKGPFLTLDVTKGPFITPGRRPRRRFSQRAHPSTTR